MKGFSLTCNIHRGGSGSPTGFRRQRDLILAFDIAKTTLAPPAITLACDEDHSGMCQIPHRSDDAPPRSPVPNVRQSHNCLRM